MYRKGGEVVGKGEGEKGRGGGREEGGGEKGVGANYYLKYLV